MITVKIVIETTPRNSLFPLPPDDVVECLADMSTEHLLGLLGALARVIQTRGVSVKINGN